MALPSSWAKKVGDKKVKEQDSAPAGRMARQYHSAGKFYGRRFPICNRQTVTAMACES